MGREEADHSLRQIAREEAPSDHGLSPRELDVLTGLRDGLTYEGIADRNCVAGGTIKQQVNNIYRKLGVKNRTKAIRKTFGSGGWDIS